MTIAPIAGSIGENMSAANRCDDSPSVGVGLHQRPVTKFSENAAASGDGSGPGSRFLRRDTTMCGPKPANGADAPSRLSGASAPFAGLGRYLTTWRYINAI